MGAIRDAGGNAFPIGADVGSVAEINQLFTGLDAELTERTGAARFDILVNNAGVAPPLSIEETTEKDFDKIYDINVKGVFFVVQAALPRLRDGVRIVNVSTGLTRSGIANPGYAAYASSKGAVNVLTTLLAKALGPRRITVNTLAPGVTDTDMNAGWLRDAQGQPSEAQKAVVAQTALGRLGRPDDFTGLAAFLASPDSDWITGQYIEASGGLAL